MTLRKQLAALLAASALALAAIGTTIAGDDCEDTVRAAVTAGVIDQCPTDSAAPESDAPESQAPESKTPESEAPPSEAPSFVQSENPESDAPSEPPPSEPPPSEPITAPPSFFQSEEGETEVPSEPDTATIGGSQETGSPSDSAWLLVVALGMLLASIVVLTPAKVRRRR